MALVRLRNDWFGPHGYFLFRGDREVPEQYLDQLPPHAQLLDDEGNPVKPKPEPVVAEPEVVSPVETVSEDKTDDAPKTVRRRAAPSSE